MHFVIGVMFMAVFEEYLFELETLVFMMSRCSR